MQMFNRKEGQEQPYWPAGPFKIRLPFVHYRWESAEMVQALIMFVVSLSIIPLLQQYLGLPYDVALAFAFVSGIGYMLPALLGVPLLPGWITPAIPVCLLYLGGFEPGPEAIKAMVALQVLVFLIFLLLGITRLGSVLVKAIPDSLKAGILIGAGIAAIMGEIEPGGRLAATPISLLVGSLASIYMLFSLSFKHWVGRHSLVKKLANYGMVPAMLLSMMVGWIIAEYPAPEVQFGITKPAFDQLLDYLPWTLGLPALEVFMIALPTAIIAYVIAFGDIIVGTTIMERVDHERPDEHIDIDVDRIHLVTALRNLLHAGFAPHPGLAGPIWTAVCATTAERYRHGRKAMDSIYSGTGTFWIAGFIALFVLPLVTVFQPVLPIALSLTLIITGYLCITIGIEQVDNSTARGVAGVVAVVLAVYGAGYALAAGVALHLILEKGGSKADDRADLDTTAPTND
ncbi:MAG: xanthine/uracil/vitamin C permease [Gammaproteobacteria bacterium]|nr:xanthine/uracil/vitamin C permease [Gammaproteobacteria bacterium]